MNLKRRLYLEVTCPGRTEVSSATSASVSGGWYQITIPPCSRLWITCDSFWAGVDAPVGDPARIPVRTGRARDRRVRVRAARGSGERHVVPGATCAFPSSGSVTPRLCLPAAKKQHQRDQHHADEQHAADGEQPPIGQAAPPPAAARVEPAIERFAARRSRRWIPEVRRLAIWRRRIPEDPIAARWHPICSGVESFTARRSPACVCYQFPAEVP